MRSWSGIGCCRLPGLFSQLPPRELLRIPGRALYIQIFIHLQMYIQIFIHIQMYIQIYMFTKVHLHRNTCELLRIPGRALYANVNVHVYTNTFTHIHIHTSLAGPCRCTQIIQINVHSNTHVYKSTLIHIHCICLARCFRSYTQIVHCMIV